VKILLKWVSKKQGSWVWAYMAQNRDKWRALENTAMKFRVLENGGNFSSNSSSISLVRRIQLHSVNHIKKLIR
jgi:hypothetical protein